MSEGKTMYRARFIKRDSIRDPKAEPLYLIHGKNTGEYSLAGKSDPRVAEHAVENADKDALSRYLEANVCANATQKSRFYRMADFAIEAVDDD